MAGRGSQGRGTDHDTSDERDGVDEAPDPAEATPEQARKYNNRSVERVVAMLNVLQESSGAMSLVQISKSINMAKATAFRYLWTLERHRYVERDEEGGYRLGLGFVGMQSRDLDLLRDRARPWLQQLRDDTDETASLGVLDGNAVRIVEVAESQRAVRLAKSSGSRDPLYSTALGKAIAGQLPAAHVRELLWQSAPVARTPNTITAVDDFLDELSRVRRRGYAIDDGENEADGRCVAAPVLGTRLPAAISVSGPTTRLTVRALEAMAQPLTEIAHRLAHDQATSRPADSEARPGEAEPSQ